jgi:hypothetical protein
MESVSEDVRIILDGESALGLTFQTNLFVGEQPKSPDECVTVFDTGPTQEDNPTYTLEYPKVMIKVRGARDAYLASYNLLDSIRTFLNGYSTTVGGTRYLSFWVMSHLWLGYDENRRPQWSLNLRTQRTA